MAVQDAQPFHWRYPDLDDKNFELHGHGLFTVLLVFVVLLFFTLLCLYVRWACRSPSRLGPSPVPGGPSQGLDSKVISSLPVLLHKQPAEGNMEGRDGEDSMCSICLSGFTDGEKVKKLPKCGHTFHPECVDEWLKTQSTCPLCRSCIGQLQKIEGGDEIV